MSTAAEDVRPIPEAIHSNEMEQGTAAARKAGYLGGLKFSPGMRRYLASAKPASVLAEELEWHEWWRSEYVVGRLQQAEAAGDIPLGGVQAVLQLKRSLVQYRRYVREHGESPDWAPYTRVAAALKRDDGWVRHVEARCERLVRTKYFPYRRPHRPPHPPPD